MAANALGGPGADPLNGDLVFVRDGAPEGTEAAIEFRQLRYFVSVAEELHFGRAAERMFISQPALSQAIAVLERALGVQLLERSRQNVELTDAGVELLTHARGMLADRHEAVDGVRRVGRGDAGVLRVGVALLAEHEVGGALAAFAAEHRGIVLDRFAAISERLLGSVADRGLHVALVHQVPVLGALDGVDWEVIRTAGLAALVPEGSPVADRPSVSLSELSEETFLVQPRELAPSAFEGLKTACQAFGGFVPKLLESSTWAIGPDWRAVVDGDAVALIAESAARATRPAGAVVVPLEPPPSLSIALAWRRGNRSPLLARFLAFMRADRDGRDSDQRSGPGAP